MLFGLSGFWFRAQQLLPAFSAAVALDISIGA